MMEKGKRFIVYTHAERKAMAQEPTYIDHI
jgi:hypothetical protein